LKLYSLILDCTATSVKLGLYREGNVYQIECHFDNRVLSFIFGFKKRGFNDNQDLSQRQEHSFAGEKD
jgi:hypothetical protein